MKIVSSSLGPRCGLKPPNELNMPEHPLVLYWHPLSSLQAGGAGGEALDSWTRLEGRRPLTPIDITISKDPKIS